MSKEKECSKVSIIIVNFNGAKFVKSCLDSLLKVTYPNLEIIFVDNASTDGSVELVKRDFGHDHRLKVIPLAENVGFCTGNNVGTRHASHEAKYLFFLNQDTEVTCDFLEKLVLVMEKDPTIGALQPKILRLPDKRRIDSLGGFIDVVGFVYGIGTLEEDLGQYDIPQEIFYAKGCALMVLKQLFEKSGGFDDEFFMWRDEPDLCWRIWLQGYKVMSIPSAIVYHYGSTIDRKNISRLSRRRYLFVRNNIAMLVKNYSAVNVLRFLPLYLTLSIIVTLYCVFSLGNVAYGKSFLDAVIWNFLNLRKTLTKRMYVQRYLRKRRDKDILGRVIIKRPLFTCQSSRQLRRYIKLE